jgi:hypothetical protein
MKQMLLFFISFSALTCCGQTGSEIILFDMKVKDGKVILSNGKNITHHKGYDNQPSFHPSKPVVYYSSFNDSGRSDIKYYDYKKKETSKLTLTNEREYSPTVTPDGKYISCIIQRDNGAQDLGMYPIEGGDPRILVNNLLVGYHVWGDRNKLLLFVLGDSGNHTLHYYDTDTKRDVIVASGIGRSIHKIPGDQSMSFVQKISDKQSLIQKFDPSAMRISPIAEPLPGTERDMTWLNNNTMLMSDGTTLYSYHVGADNSWQPVFAEGDISMLKGITRLAVNRENNKLAVVVSE